MSCTALEHEHLGISEGRDVRVSNSGALSDRPLLEYQILDFGKFLNMAAPCGGIVSEFQCLEFPRVLNVLESSGFGVTLTGSSSVSVPVEMENTRRLVATSAAKDEAQRLHSCLKARVSSVLCVC